MVVKTTIGRVRVLELSEKAKSRAQQRFFGMVRATQKGEMDSPSSEVAQAAASISTTDVKKFAKTKHKGLPEKKKVEEGSLHKWFKGSKSKDGKGGWVNVVTGGTCASDEPGEGTPKCVSSSKRASMTKAERLSASRRKKKADPGQQQKSGAAKPTYVATDKKKKVNEAVKGQDTLSRKQGAKERASEKRAHDSWKSGPVGKTKEPLYSTTRHTKKVGDDYARQQKQSIKWHHKRTKGRFIAGTTTSEGTSYGIYKGDGKVKIAGYEKLKKKIGSKEKHDKPAIQETASFRQFMADAQAAKDRQKKKIEDRKKKDAQFVDTKKHGVKFYDKKGAGRIKSGKKIYD